MNLLDLVFNTRMDRKVYCACDSDFTSHFKQQAGKGFDDITIYRGQPYQRGYGFGSIFRRIGIPILKFFGKELLKTGINVGKDVLDDKKFKEALKTRGKEGIRSAAKRGLSEIESAFDQQGSGFKSKKKKITRKRKQKKKKQKVVKKRYKKTKSKPKPKQKSKKRKDIFE